ncbi:aminopeptidase N [Pseudomonas sp. M47T1]|nr:aminopeptidase N C-terminal domain-containing protein [Pseudomonas sp. M47T1]EIK94986.1 aminopeptidase N [Pseudomonas sp. M47T1]
MHALIGAFARQNLINFHSVDGSGYRFLADLVIQLNALNPPIASNWAR